MADLTLRVNGENNAGPALKEAASGVSNLSNEVATGIAKWQIWGKAISAATDFLKESYKASQEQEKADRQLARVAGESTEAFKRQAAALQSSLGVSDDMVQTMQTMLLRFGESRSEVDKTVRALLDYSAATGTDAVQATQELLMSAKTGRAAFKDLNLSVDNTHGSMTTLASTTAALAARLGGSAEAEANTLEGATRKASQQFGELQETFGGFVGLLAQKTGVIESATWALARFNNMLNPDADTRKSDAFDRIQAAMKELKVWDAQVAAGQRLPNEYMAKLRKQIADGQREWEQANVDMGLSKDGSPLKQKYTLEAGEVTFTKPDKKAEEAAKKAAELRKRIEADRFANAESANEYATGLQSKFDDITRKAREDFEKEEEKEFTDARAKKIKEFGESKDEEMKLMIKGLNEQADLIKKQDDQWANAGAAIGGAFAGALSNALADLASGGEMDAGETIGSILASVLGVAGSVLGGIAGSAIPGLGTALGATIGGSLGGLAGAGIKAATRKKRHDGGYAGDFPRYHAGTWVGSDEEAAILQNGERVLSRPEVSAMGGPRGVERAVNGGGGGMTINVSTFDGSTAREYFEKQGGRALQNTLRTGRGVLPGLLGAR